MITCYILCMSIIYIIKISTEKKIIFLLYPDPKKTEGKCNYLM